MVCGPAPRPLSSQKVSARPDPPMDASTNPAAKQKAEVRGSRGRGIVRPGSRSGSNAPPRALRLTPSPTFSLLLLLCAGSAHAAGWSAVRDHLTDDHGGLVFPSYAFGLNSSLDLPEYRQTGFNTIYLELPARDGADPRDLVLLADAAEAAKLNVIGGLDAFRAVVGDRLLDVGDPQAVAAVTAWIKQTVTAWQATPALVAYALPHDVESHLALTQASLTLWLARRYRGRIDLLNAAWGTNFSQLERIDEAGAFEAAAQQPGGFGRAGIDLARWRAETVAQMLLVMTRAVQSADPSRPVIGGRMPRYRTLLQAPATLAALQPARVPGINSDDTLNHEAGQVAMASQGRRFAVIPTTVSNATPPMLVHYGRLLLSRGAAGLAYATWSDLRGRPDRQAAVRQVLGEAADPAQVLYRPHGGAALVTQALLRGPLVGDQRLYGYGDFGGGHPAGLLDLVQAGTRYGTLDVLTPRDLTRVKLGDYGCLLVTGALELSDLDVEALRGFVEQGGVLYGDLGLGCAEPTGDPRYLPAPLALAFGLQIAEIRLPAEVLLTSRQRDRVRSTLPGQVAFPELLPTLSHPGSFVFKRASALLPAIQPIKSTAPDLARTLLLTPAAFVLPGGNTRMLAEQAQIGGRGGRQPAVSGLSEQRYGRGTACFGSTWLCGEWGPGDRLFDEFAGGLLGQRPKLTLVSSRGLTPTSFAASRDGDRLCLGRTGDAETAVVDLPVTAPHVYAGGLNVVRRAPTVDPHAPVVAAAEPLILRRIVDLAAGEFRYDRPLPLQCWPEARSAAVEVLRYGPDELELVVYGQADEALRDTNGHWYLPRPAEVPVTLVVADGRYPVQPGSLHRLAIREAMRDLPEAVMSGTAIKRDTLTADAQGRLVFRHSIDRCRITLSPVQSVPVP